MSVMALLLMLYLAVVTRVVVLQQPPSNEKAAPLDPFQRETWKRPLNMLEDSVNAAKPSAQQSIRQAQRASKDDSKSHKGRDIPHAAIRSDASNNVHDVKFDSMHDIAAATKEKQMQGERERLRGGRKEHDEDLKTAEESELSKNQQQKERLVEHAQMPVEVQADREANINEKPVTTDTTLRAYLEPIHREDWNTKPLPVRTITSDQLTKIEYSRVNSCLKLLEQFPVDDYPDEDPFLPWIHDVFPTHDGKLLQFVAQNKRRCHTGTTAVEVDILQHTEPQVALFQHVPVKRNTVEDKTRYRLSSHEEADEDGVATRFICRFKPSMEETLSVHNVDYDYATYRKGGKHTFTKEGRDNKSIHTSQLVFYCPIPEILQRVVKEGTSIQEDYATLFVDLIPIRTPPRYGPPDTFFPPRYKQHQQQSNWTFDPSKEWGDNHVLPLVENSGRWENIPICKPSLQEYEPSALDTIKEDEKKHRLIACVWASSGYTTRGERFAINDGQRRLKEWLTFNFLVGFDHVYVYDNSGTQPNAPSLKSVTDLFPAENVTRIVWPHRVCNNRKNNVDSPGERSSQYAAEASCRLRFGPHAEWLGGFDIDEYLVPLGNYTSLTQILDKLDQEDNKIISFGSWRAWPRRSLIEEPKTINDAQVCGRRKPCFNVEIPPNRTILQSYNCDRQRGQKTEVMPAEKQLYRPDYVKQHFVHFSTITELSQMSKSETVASKQVWRNRIGADPKSRFSNEINEGTMLHTKAVATQDTADWLNACKGNGKATCRIGNPYPEGAYEANITKDEEGWVYNCFVNEWIENYWVPKLEQAMKLVT